MLTEVVSFLINALLQPFAGIVLFRFHAVWMNAPMRNPIGEFVMALTDFAVLPLRRALPAIGKFDTGSFLFAFVLAFIYLLIGLALRGYPFDHFPAVPLLLWTLLELASLSLYLLMAALLIQAILSWTNPHSPLQPFLHMLTGRFLAPIRRVIPLVGSIDLSPLVVLLACQLLLIVPLGSLEQAILRML